MLRKEFDELGRGTWEKLLVRPDPGPIDRSVLVEQEYHKSEAIFTGRGYKPIRFIEHGTRLNQWEVKHDGMLELLRTAGFYYLSRLKRVQLDHALLNALVERWRRETQTFHLRFGEITILLKDVAILAGLRVDGSPVTLHTDCRWEQLCLELLGQEPPQIKGGSIGIAWLYDTFHTIPEGAGQAQVQYATRAYILYQIGCSLFPDPSGTRVHLRYLALLRNFDMSGEMAWGAAVLAHLYRELGKASMKGKANCCAFLTLLQIWAWEHIQIGRPERLEDKALLSGRPLGCRWNVPFKSRENARSLDHEFYRHGIDTILDSQITWDPYTTNLMSGLPAICTSGSAVWLCRTPLICFQIVEMHVPDRVLLQFGMIQHIPDAVEMVERVTMQGKADEDWSLYHDKYIKQWDSRLSTVVEQNQAVDPDPTRARNHYLEWYWRITRRWISTPVDRPVISYQSLGHGEIALVDVVMTVQKRIRRLLSGDVERKRIRATLTEIDAYIATELEKAKHFTSATATSELGCSGQQQQFQPSSSVQNLPLAAIPITREAARTVPFKSDQPSSSEQPMLSTVVPVSLDPMQTTVAKVEYTSDDNAEGNTILQLDKTRSIQPMADDRHTELHMSQVQESSLDQLEEAHMLEEAVDASTKEPKVHETNLPTKDAVVQGTPVEDNKMQGTIDTPAENAEVQETVEAPTVDSKMQEVVDSYMKDDKVQESVDTPIGTTKVHSKMQEVVDSYMKDDKVQESVDTPIGTMKVQEAIDAPLKDDKVHMTVNAVIEEEKLQQVIDAPLKDDKVQMNIDAAIEEDKLQEVIDSPIEYAEGTIDAAIEEDKLQEVIDSPIEYAEGTIDARMKKDEVRDSINGYMEHVEVQEAVDGPIEDEKVHVTVHAPSVNTEVQETIDAHMKDNKMHNHVNTHMEHVKEQEIIDMPMAEDKEQVTIVVSTGNAEVQETVDAPMRDDEVHDCIEPHEDRKVEENIDAPIENLEVHETVDTPIENANDQETVNAPMESAKVQEMISAPISEAVSAKMEVPSTQGGDILYKRRKRKRVYVQFSS
ncbi:uncharacterized protein [Typha latifolia]|uniref:uncharacterized protein isoform X2 n=1 Tax=Typha latifolia TaxID=4733 RepID=UPI003C2C647C